MSLCNVYNNILRRLFWEIFVSGPGPAQPSPRLLTGNIWSIVFVIGCKHKNFLLGKHLYCHMQQAFLFFISICIYISYLEKRAHVTNCNEWIPKLTLLSRGSLETVKRETNQTRNKHFCLCCITNFQVTITFAAAESWELYFLIFVIRWWSYVRKVCQSYTSEEIFVRRKKYQVP